jgi:hypothetical protein
MSSPRLPEVTKVAQQLPGPLKVVAASRLYRCLVAKAHQSSLALTSRPIDSTAAGALAAWLPADLRDVAQVVLTRGLRWPQELVTRADLIRLVEGRNE